MYLVELDNIILTSNVSHLIIVTVNETSINKIKCN